MIRKYIDEIKQIYNDNVILKNIYHTHHSKNALILYVVRPFRKPNMPLSHTNIVESRIMADELSKCGYNIDIANYNNKRRINYRKYHFIIGFGDGLANANEGKLNECKLVYYATTACYEFANNAEKKRIQALYERRGVKAVERRQEKFVNETKMRRAIQDADAIFCVGNDWTSSTYINWNKTIYQTGVTGFYKYTFYDMRRDYNNARKNFLWIGGSGMIHKGLDLCLEFFSKNTEMNLYIVGNMEQEFANIYEKELKNPNIFIEGFIDVQTERFKEICNNCMFVIYPSCSEGCATSVVTAMFTGLIPIVTESSGVTIGSAGVSIKDTDITSAIDKARNIELSELENRSKKIFSLSCELYKQERYRERLRTAFDVFKD